MLNFESDYIEGAHPRILERLVETNFEKLSGYGEDEYSYRAKEKIKEKCASPESEIEFLVGGTQTNQIVISSLLRPFEGVIAANAGHISLHEAGAIEVSGHKVINIKSDIGKLRAADVEEYLTDFSNDESRDHMVLPKMVYISHPTEYGLLYSLEELKALSEVCHRYGMHLYLDGARLGYALMSRCTDVTLMDIAELCDVFYIGGTKVGALCGEAVVFRKGIRPEHFTALKKQRGGLLAKGRLTGVQFDTLFTDDLYYLISAHAIDLAEMLKNVFLNKGYKLFVDSPTNQQFVILENTKMKELSQKVKFCPWEKYDAEHTVVRFATSWATREEDVHKLSAFL